MQRTEVKTDSRRFIGPDANLLKSPEFQRSYHYLDASNKGRDLSSYTYKDEKEADRLVIEILKQNSGLENPTWAQLTFFATFLNLQLIACERNHFVGSGEFQGFKNFYIKHCLIAMAKDFALPSLSIADNSPLFGLNESTSNYEVHQIRRRWESSPHPYVFINSDQMTFTFLGVRITNSNLLDCKGNLLAQNVMSTELQDKIKRQAIDEKNVLDENFDELELKVKQLKLCRVLGVEPSRIQFDDTYELTQDNVMKLLAVYMRFRCNIPVVIMGETGCGKTKLVEYLCNLLARGENVENKKIVKVHGGITMQDIIQSIEDVEKLAIENRKKFGEEFFTVLFFDEANTTEAIYGIKEVICDFSVNGRKLDPNSGLKVIVACNPYRKHKDKMIKKLESQGLGYHVKASETSEKLDSDIPMRHLVYRVNPLPPSLLPLIWDFGQLSSEVENKYIEQIVSKRAASMSLTPGDVLFICHVLSQSQNFLRENREECLFVSLRDIERAMTVLQFFHSKLALLMTKMKEMSHKQSEMINDVARLMILTLGVCYHSSLESRSLFRDVIAACFTGSYSLPNGPNTILNELEMCMQVFIQNIILDRKANIAKNLALTENVFMIIICIELRIPLFLVGKPGSSKSLAKTIVIDAMQGESSRNEFFQSLKQVQMLSFQCSPHTQADGIISLFKQAALYQEGKNLQQFVSVVVLDEIGLAEDSAKMPLKTLHPLLEEGYVENKSEKQDWGKVGFVGISNWALDPAKMNRGILVSRGIPNSEELVKSARGICRVENEGKIIDGLIQPLADAYQKVYSSQIEKGLAEYFGLRDFYGLLKMLYKFLVSNRHRGIQWQIIRRAIRRNFGEKGVDSLTVFANELQEKRVFDDVTVSDAADTLQLVHENIQEAEERSKLTEEERSLDNESRYLLLMTENFSALQLLPKVLKLKEYEVIFGSSFPHDQQYIQVCKNINRIKVCMETGKTVVLLNLGSLYESLYDALNQYYVYYGGKRYVDLGLGTNRVKCSVSENFRLIMIEEEKVARHFPIPLLNRLEKHFLGMESVLNSNLMKLRKKLSDNLEAFSNVPRTDKEDSLFHVRDAFVGYQIDTTACVLIQAENSLPVRATDEQLLEAASLKLVQTCSIDAIIRSNCDVPSFNLHNLKEIYGSQGRNSLSEFLWEHCYTGFNGPTQSELIEISTFCRIPSARDMKHCNTSLMQKEKTLMSPERHFVINLNVFKTEIEFAERVKDFYRMAAKHKQLTKILFITCSKGQKFVSLISSAKYKLQNLHADYKIPKLYHLFIVELPRNWYESDYSSFSVGKWESFHIDELLRAEELQILSEVAIKQSRTLKDIFALENGECSKFQKKLLREVVCEAIGQESGGDKIQKVTNIYRLLDERHDPRLETVFLQKVSAFIEKSDENAEIQKWVTQKAANLQDLIESGTIETALFKELQARIKPHIADFMKMIDLNNNIKLLFEGKWQKNAWMRLFTIKDICRERTGNLNEVKFESVFPFSNEIIVKLSSQWTDALENCNDFELDDWQFFVREFHKQEKELEKAIISISEDRSAVDAFIHDLIMNEFISMMSKSFVLDEHVEMAKKYLKFIIDNHLADSETPTIAVAYAHFKKFSPHLYKAAPILKFFGSSLRILHPNNGKTFDSVVAKVALELTESIADNLKPANLRRQEIEALDQRVSVLKLCSGIELEVDAAFKLKKLSMFSTYLTQISQNLDDDLTVQIACTASDKIYQFADTSSADDKVFGTDQFRAQLLLCLSQSAAAIEQATGQKRCAFCKSLVNSNESAAFSHECTMQDVHYSNMIVAPEGPQKSIWKQFWLNISNAFLRIVKENVIKVCDEATLRNYIEVCLIYKRRKSKKDAAWITEQIKQGLLTFIATSEHWGKSLDKLIVNIVNDDKKSNIIDLARTYKLLLSVFEFVYQHESFFDLDDVSQAKSTVSQIRLVAKVKIELLEFVSKSVVPYAQVEDGHVLHETIPRIAKEILEKGGESAEYARKYFIQIICRNFGLDMYQKVKSVPQLEPLIPRILLISKNEGFSDVFLVLGSSYQMPFNKAYIELVTNVDTAIDTLRAVKDLQLRNLVVYQLLAEMRSKQFAAKNATKFEQLIGENSKTMRLSISVTNKNDKLAPNMGNLRHLLFFFQTFLEVNENCGFMKPFKDIFDARGRVNGLYLPTFPDSGARRAKIVENALQDELTTWNKCPNGHFYIISACGMPMQRGLCPECKKRIGGEDHEYAAGNKMAAKRGGNVSVTNETSITGYSAEPNLNSFDRDFLNAFNGSVMQFFVHAVLYVCKQHEEMLHCARKNIAEISRNSVNRSEEDVIKFLLTVIIDASTKPVQGSFDNEEQRELFEIAFIEIINDAQRKLPEVISNYYGMFQNDCRNESNSLKQFLEDNEDNSSEKLVNILENRSYWRLIPKVSLAGVRSELNINVAKYKLLDCIFKNKEWMTKLAHIPDLFELFNNLVEYYDPDTSNRVKTFDEFSRQTRIPEKVRRRMRETARVFCELWNSEVRQTPSIGGLSCGYTDRLNLDSPLKYFLPTRHVSNCCALVTVNTLVDKNNEFIVAYRSALKIETPLVFFCYKCRFFYLNLHFIIGAFKYYQLETK